MARTVTSTSGTSTRGTSTRGSSTRGGRREAILDAAARLFSTRGYAETGIDEIGEAVGVTGPAVYRHFASKQDLLVAALERAVDDAAAILPLVRAEGLGPDESVRRLVDLTARACIDDRALALLYWREAKHLPEGPRTELDRRQRAMIAEYAELVRAVRTDLTPSDARMAVHAAASLMRSVATRGSSLGQERLHTLLSSMAYEALMGARPG